VPDLVSKGNGPGIIFGGNGLLEIMPHFDDAFR
jgi:hypothetical protein